MSICHFHRPGSRRRVLAGDVPNWITNNDRAPYILAVMVSAPDWVDHRDLQMLRAWAKARTIFTGQRHVLDHIVPVNHPRVCGLTVPWNLQVIHWRANGSKGNTWCPEQLELFPTRSAPHRLDLPGLSEHLPARIADEPPEHHVALADLDQLRVQEVKPQRPVVVGRVSTEDRLPALVDLGQHPGSLGHAATLHRDAARHANRDNS